MNRWTIFRIGLAQLNAGDSKDSSLKKAISIIEDGASKEVDLMVFPELYMAYLQPDDPIEKYMSVAEPLDGPFVSAISEEARSREMHVAVGVYEKPESGGRVHNTIVLVGPDGSLLSANRKLHCFDAFGFRESDRFKPADKPGEVAETPLGRIGTMVCYDLRFPEVARMQAVEGAEIILVPAAWVKGSMKEDHWITLTKARGLENTVFLAACSQPGRLFTGRSVVVDPFGVVICDGGEGEGLIVTEVDLKRIGEVRERLPCLEQLRKDVYKGFWSTHA